ncbi:hypothetical protein EJF36_16885 [Bacillus sp. HMF5848]|uniref:hypothetical protein n=1 Tax=Bacillus sp. HMF5848 TaxID=2495421 RepID=UPI000F782675|nr:hypothetical protein [Bacillus sp. HMF5848]RSK28406.1 hypothetical protein EJF36_16885 [Bacillus sp. HMF5848]
MFHWGIWFLGFIPYFPENKLEYIPGAITTLIFAGAAAYATYLFIRHSKKEAAKAKELEEKMKNEYNNRR